MKKDTIYRNEAILAIQNEMKEDKHILFRLGLATAKKIIYSLPTAKKEEIQSEELIRCKDCIYSDPFERDTAVRWLPCMNVVVSKQWFCGSAKRKEERISIHVDTTEEMKALEHRNYVESNEKFRKRILEDE